MTSKIPTFKQSDIIWTQKGEAYSNDPMMKDQKSFDEFRII